MLLSVDHHSGLPVYKQIIQQVSLQITSGVLKPGEPLESVRQLSSQLNINPMTVSKAYAFLEHDGLVERRPGRPLIVAEREEKAMDKDREEHLIEALKPAVTTAKQLGFENGEAVKTYRQLLEEADS